MPEGAYTVYRRERRGRRWPYFFVAVACVLAVPVVWQLVNVPRVSAVAPGPNSFVKHRAPMVVLEVHGLARLSGVRVTLDGRNVTGQAARRGNTLSLATAGLADGTHTVSFSAASSNMFRHRVQRSWRFTVDTTVPTLELKGPTAGGRITSLPATFKGSTEPFSTVTVASGSTVKAGAQAGADGRYSVSARLPDGPSQVTITAVDRAGNSASRRLPVYVDAVPPVLNVTHLADTLRHSGLKIHVSAHDQLVTPKVRLLLDGLRRTLRGPVSHGVLKLKSLAQGAHTLIVTAADRGGNVVTNRQTFVVDSTEQLGAAALWPGARGKDVRQLQKHLLMAGVFRGETSNVYDGRTMAAVKKFEAKYGLTVDGLVAGRTLTALSGEIVVDLSRLRLYLYRGGKLFRSYPVAAGQPAYPTPTGTFAIVTMTMNPTWLPPNSDWAKNATKIPPGAENPLGTRWMGTSAPGVGIHGVPPSEDGSIGTYASHGCLRMHNADAVALFSRVSVGMPVVIRE